MSLLIIGIMTINCHAIPVPGDRIVIKGIGEGEVLEFKNNNVFVKSGLLKTRVKLSDIMILDKPKKKPVKNTT